MSADNRNDSHGKPEAMDRPDMAQDNSLIPMLVGGLVLIVVGMFIVAWLA